MSKDETGYLTLSNSKDPLTSWQQWHQQTKHNREESLEIYSLTYDEAVQNNSLKKGQAFQEMVPQH